MATFSLFFSPSDECTRHKSGREEAGSPNCNEQEKNEGGRRNNTDNNSTVATNKHHVDANQLDKVARRQPAGDDMSGSSNGGSGSSTNGGAAAGASSSSSAAAGGGAANTSRLNGVPAPGLSRSPGASEEGGDWCNVPTKKTKKGKKGKGKTVPLRDFISDHNSASSSGGGGVAKELIRAPRAPRSRSPVAPDDLSDEELTVADSIRYVHVQDNSITILTRSPSGRTSPTS